MLPCIAAGEAAAVVVVEEVGAVRAGALVPILHRTARPGAQDLGLQLLLVTAAVARPCRYTWHSLHDDPPRSTAAMMTNGKTFL